MRYSVLELLILLVLMLGTVIAIAELFGWAFTAWDRWSQRKSMHRQISRFLS